MLKIDWNRTHTMADWLHVLCPSNAFALIEMAPMMDDDDVLFAFDVLKYIIAYRGGISSVDQLMYLLTDVFFCND